MEDVTAKEADCTFTMPSKFTLTIREQNGDDDDTISKMKNAIAGDSVDKFLSGIITGKDGIATKVMIDEIAKWKTKDRYYAAFKSRIFSLGPILNFTHTCSNTTCNKDTDFEEDLTQYDRDFSLEDDKSSNGFKYQATPYPNKEAVMLELATSRGKKLRYYLHNGEIERKALVMDKNEISKNTQITMRGLEWFTENEWRKVSSFREFSSKEMTEIRKHIDDNDTGFDVWSEMVCPYCNNLDKVSLIAQPDFFFPGETS